MSNKKPVAVFDLGGVIVRICQTWQEAIQVAEVESPLLAQSPIPLTEFPPFNAYQATDLSLSEYLVELASFVGVTEDQALRIHLGILRAPYPGIDSVIDGLQEAEVTTGCLSNTNAPHWHAMTETEPFAPVARLDYRAGSHELGCAKPDLAAFQAYADKFGIADCEIVYFDDSRPNVEAALSLGWSAHLIDPWGDPPAQIDEILKQRIPAYK